MSADTKHIYQKLDAFIRRYYLNQLLKGFFLFIGIGILTFIVVSFIEYTGQYTSKIRSILFYSCVVVSLVVLVLYCLLPLLGLIKIRSSISHAQAAKLIGNHFPEIQDKLMNVLQLMPLNAQEGSLLDAAIHQKIQEMSPIPFMAALPFKTVLNYLKIAIAALVLGLVFFIQFPEIIKGAGTRVLFYNQVFKKEAPFQLSILNNKLSAEQYQDFILKIEFNGKQVPEACFIYFQDQRYQMNAKQMATFEYEWKNIQQDIQFTIEAAGFEFGPYLLEVKNKPLLLNYGAFINYPQYTGYENKSVNSTGDFTVPEGTQITWNFTAKHTDSVMMVIAKTKQIAQTKDQVHFQIQKKIGNSFTYTIYTKSNNGLKGDSLLFTIVAIPDLAPQIEINEQADSLSKKIIYFSGKITDDYGLSKLNFCYKFVKSDNPAKINQGLVQIPIQIDASKNQLFNYLFNGNEIGIELGDELIYYFEVWDNDRVHGPKSTKSQQKTEKAPDAQSLKEASAKGAKALQNKLNEALQETKKLQQDIKQLVSKKLNEKQLKWEDQQKLEQLLKKQIDLTQQIESIKKDFKNNQLKEQEFKKENEQIIQKQAELEKLMKEVLPDELKKLMSDLEKQIKQQNKDRIQDELNQIQLNNKDVEKELDRMLSMYKELEMEKQLTDHANELEKLAEKQQDLSNQKNKNETIEQQQKIEEEFKNLQQNLDKLAEENKTLEQPKSLDQFQRAENDIEQKLNDTKEQLKNGNNSKANQKQKELAQEMKELAQEMKSQLAKEEEKQNEMNIQALREVLDNLILLSTSQENIMESFKQINGYNPQFVQFGQSQKLIKDNAKIIEDSILSISKEVPEMRSFVNREVGKMNEHLSDAIEGFNQRRHQEIVVNQQYAMMRMNNLALMLSDVLKQLQEQKQQQKSGKGGKGKPSKKPGSGSPSMSKLKQMQDELNKQLKEGLNQNGSGEQGKTSSEKFAKMAAQQMAIRQQLQKMLSEMDALQKEQMGGSRPLNELQKQMQETEKELFNKKLTQQTLMRQQAIMSRMLEHEKAEKKQDQDNKREAEQAKEQIKPSPVYFQQFNTQKKQQLELLQTVPPGMQPYYKDKAKEYLNALPK